ncbi:unnamed protein product [Anisakis simplex]|uniref:Pre-mRNA-splicing factor 18 n=1 Tax=Anisakis simplex TaxID=6269 RepID=A0A0M3K7C6_ANISI|nr:unnamed protein product [Anisakis simplex]
MDVLKAEIERKRKQVKDVVDEVSGKKYFKRGELVEKQKQAYWQKYNSKHGLCVQSTSSTNEAVSDNDSKKDTNHESKEIIDESDDLSRAEVIRRLRTRSQPITLFGESESESRARLRKLEIEQPDMKEGWKNDFQSAMREVDHELVEEVIKGEQNSAGKHDVDMPGTAEDTDWERIEANAQLLGEGDNPNRDCDIIREFFNYILTRWGKALNARDELKKRSAEGKLAATMHKQTMEHLRPLLTSLERHTTNTDIREHIVKICRLIIIERDYIRANNAYMEMAIGNAPWPVGVTRSGLHQRPGSAKAYVSNIAHVLNDETQRKYIQAFKRIMSLCQRYFPTDPSKCVEYVRNDPNLNVEIDDIEDCSILRRTVPVTHHIYGVPRTINSANYIYFVVLSKCLQLQNPKAVQIFTDSLLELHRGQGRELYWRDTVQCPTESEYEQMVLEKTGGLFSLAVRLIELFSSEKYQFASLLNNIALYFQIRDDYINLCSTDYAKQKSFAEDLSEGKFSFPIVIAIRRDDPDDEILNILRRKTTDYEVKKYCISLLHERGAFSYTLKRLRKLYESILTDVKRLGGNKQIESFMEDLNGVLAEDSGGKETINTS